MLVREIAGLGRFYRFILSGSLRLSITVFVTAQSRTTIFGITGIPSYYTYFISKIRSFGQLSILIKNIRVSLTPKVVISEPVYTQTTVQVNSNYDANYDFNCLKV